MENLDEGILPEGRITEDEWDKISNMEITGKVTNITKRYKLEDITEKFCKFKVVIEDANGDKFYCEGWEFPAALPYVEIRKIK